MKKITPITIFGVAMGFFEAVVVVYLRQIYYPEGFNFPLKAMPGSLLITECSRETATIIMLVCFSIIADKNFSKRVAYFLYAFGIWDVFYYVFLKLILNWPESLLIRDVLFLIPLPWIAPVLAPLIIAVTMIIIALIAIIKIEKGYELRPSKLDWSLGFIGALIIFLSFISYLTGMNGREIVVTPYHWELLIIGELIWVFVFYRILNVNS